MAERKRKPKSLSLTSDVGPAERPSSFRASFSKLSKVLGVHEQTFKKWRREGLLGDYKPKATGGRSALEHDRTAGAMLTIGSWLKWLYPGKVGAHIVELAMRRSLAKLSMKIPDDHSTILLIQKDVEDHIQSKVFNIDNKKLKSLNKKLESVPEDSKEVESMADVFFLDVIKTVWINVTIVERMSIELIESSIEQGSFDFEDFEKNFSTIGKIA